MRDKLRSEKASLKENKKFVAFENIGIDSEIFSEMYVLLLIKGARLIIYYFFKNFHGHSIHIKNKTYLLYLLES